MQRSDDYNYKHSRLHTHIILNGNPGNYIINRCDVYPIRWEKKLKTVRFKNRI